MKTESKNLKQSCLESEVIFQVISLLRETPTEEFLPYFKFIQSSIQLKIKRPISKRKKKTYNENIEKKLWLS